MNERIRELAREAGLLVYNPEGVPTKLEKFAELIVEQFDIILVNEYLDCVGENDKKSQFRVDRLRKRVKEYFGIDT